MDIVSKYKNIGSETRYEKFICKLDANTEMAIAITDDNKIKLTFIDIPSAISDICATIDNEDLIGLIRALRTVSNEVEKANGQNSNDCLLKKI